MNLPDISDKISDLVNIMRKTCSSPTETAQKINSILIYGYDVPSNLLEAAWDHFVSQRGVRSGQ